MMVLILRVVITLLIGLQGIAPLIHAHSQQDFSLTPNQYSPKLHIPGLEDYYALGHSISMHDVMPAEGVLISMNQGIKSSYYPLRLVKEQLFLVLTFIPIIIVVVLSLFRPLFTIFFASFRSYCLLPAYAPRAPPFYFYSIHL
jgi:hypothetical protein